MLRIKRPKKAENERQAIKDGQKTRPEAGGSSEVRTDLRSERPVKKSDFRV